MTRAHIKCLLASTGRYTQKHVVVWCVAIMTSMLGNDARIEIWNQDRWEWWMAARPLEAVCFPWLIQPRPKVVALRFVGSEPCKKLKFIIKVWLFVHFEAKLFSKLSQNHCILYLSANKQGRNLTKKIIYSFGWLWSIESLIECHGQYMWSYCWWMRFAAHARHGFAFVFGGVRIPDLEVWKLSVAQRTLC